MLFFFKGSFGKQTIQGSPKPRVAALDWYTRNCAFGFLASHVGVASFLSLVAGASSQSTSILHHVGMQLYPGNCLRTQRYLYWLELQRFSTRILLSRKIARWQFEYAGGDLVSYQCCGGALGEYDDAVCHSLHSQAKKVSLSHLSGSKIGQMLNHTRIFWKSPELYRNLTAAKLHVIQKSLYM